MHRSVRFLTILAIILAIAVSACNTATLAPTVDNSTVSPAPVAHVIAPTSENSTATYASTTDKILVPVSMSPSDNADCTVAAWLTRPTNGKDAILITVPGSTYSHSYWDFPYKPEIYSFAQAMAKEGYSILNIDRLGTGESSKPKADITDDVQCFVVHQIAKGLRSGSIGGHAYKKIFLVGHSLGSCVIIEEQATYADADGLIITGLLHSQSFPGQGVASLAPLMENSASSDDPIFKGVPYIAYTTVPGERGHAFYNLAQVDPQVLAVDEQTRTFTPVAENSVFLSVGLSDQVKVPVFIAVGEVDRLFSSPPDKLTTDGVRSGESQYFPLSPDLSFFVLPGSGHDINLHYDAQQWYDAAKAWLARQKS